MRKTSTWFRKLIPAVIVFSAVLVSVAAVRAAAPSHEGDFFIITSVNLRMHELFLKFPTEVTELMLVNDQTVFLDEQGKPITVKSLRAGDTVYVISVKGPSGEPVARRIQLGPMTSAILHSRYLNYK